MADKRGAIQPISVLRPSQLVAAELRQRILRGEWDEDAPLPPASELAAKLGISRHHLREALRLLEHDGLIRIERGPTGGVALAMPDEEAVTRILEGILARKQATRDDTHTARAVLDAAVAGLAAEMATAEDIAELDAMVDEEQENGWQQCTDFHMAIARATHNQSLIVVIRSTWPIGTVTGGGLSDKLEGTRRKPALGREAVQSHHDLLEALKARDSAKTSELMHAHHDAMWSHYKPIARNLKIGAGGDG